MKKTTLVKIQRNLSQYQLFSTSCYAYSYHCPVIYIVEGNKRTPCVPAVRVGARGLAGFPTEMLGISTYHIGMNDITTEFS